MVLRPAAGLRWIFRYQSHSPATFIRDLGAAYRASGRATPIMDVFDQHVYADNSSLPPSMTHASSSTVTEADYTKLVSLLGTAFDGTSQRGSSLPILRYSLELRASDAAGNVGRASVTVGAVRATRGGAASPGGWTFGPPPANDLFAAAQRVSSWHGHAAGSTAFASSERREPFRRSVWFTWRAPADGPLRLGAGSAHVSVYTGGSLSTLRRVALAGSSLDARRGTTYRIAVDGGHGAFALAWRR
jgi:hypothetical protein